jgi:hypothetical protein
MKHEDALELINVWVHIVVDLPPLIVMGNKKLSVSSKDNVRPF